MQRATNRWRTHAVACAAAAACAAAVGCSGSSSASQAAPARTVAASDGGTQSASGGGQPTKGGGQPVAAQPTTGSPAAACVTQTLGRLSLAQRVGQLFLVGVDGNTAGPALTAAESKYHFGSFLLNKTSVGTARLAAQTAGMRQLASSGTAGVGSFIAANQEGGEVQQLAGPGFTTMPSAVVQGTMSPGALRTAATGWATDLRAAGVNLDLAPVMDVVPPGTAAGNAPIGALDREFGFDPATAGAHGAAFVTGMAAVGVETVAKHFPGLGRVTGNTDFTPDVVDNVTTANDPYLSSYRAAITAGVPMVMVALATYPKIDPAELAVFSPTMMKLLRGGLSFTGVIVSDDLGQAQAVQMITPSARAVRFLAVGGDLITSQTLLPAEQMAAGVLAKAETDAAFRATVDAAARQVLTAKRAAHLLAC